MDIHVTGGIACVLIIEYRTPGIFRLSLSDAAVVFPADALKRIHFLFF